MRKFGDALSVMMSKVLARFGLVSKGKTFYVHDTLGQDGSNDGLTPDQPLKTLDYAVGLCTASQGYNIVLMEGHNEGSSGVIADLDVAGITVIGQGVGGDRPILDFNLAAATVDVGANNITIKNVVFRPHVAAVLIGLDIETGVTGTVIEDCEFAMGEAGDGTDEFVKAIHLTSANHDTVIRNTKILAHASANGATHGIHVDAASDRLTLDNVVIDGPFTNGIVEDAAGKNHIAIGCSVDATDSALGFHASSTFAVREGNRTGSQLVAQTQEGEEAGTIFTIKKTVNHNTVVVAGADLTGASSGGPLQLIDAIVQTATAMTSGGAAVLELYSNNVLGNASFFTAAKALLTANAALGLADGTSQNSLVLESGAKLLYKASSADFTSDANVDIYLVFRRLATGAKVAAA